VSVGSCDDELQAELPALVSALHAGGATAIHISHHVDGHGACRLTIEAIRPERQPASETPNDRTWEYRWP
jgi:hypothetical protein